RAGLSRCERWAVKDSTRPPPRGSLQPPGRANPPAFMKILIFNWQDIKNPLAGGAEVHLHELFSRIAGMGHDVTLFCSAFDGALPEEKIDGIRVIREGGRYLFNVRVPYRYFTRFRSSKYDLIIDDMNK